MAEKRKRLPHAPIWCELVCRTCARHIVGQFATNRLPRAQLIRDAEAKNARFWFGEVFCGPDCQLEYTPPDEPMETLT